MCRRFFVFITIFTQNDEQSSILTSVDWSILFSMRKTDDLFGVNKLAASANAPDNGVRRRAATTPTTK